MLPASVVFSNELPQDILPTLPLDALYPSFNIYIGPKEPKESQGKPRRRKRGGAVEDRGDDKVAI